MILIWIGMCLSLASGISESAQAAWAGRIGGDYTLGSWKHSGVLSARVVNTAAVNVSAGVEKWFFYVGPSFEYFVTGQLTSPGSVDGTNVLGRGFVVGPLLAISAGRLRLTGTYQLLGKYLFSKVTGAGEERSYSLPNASWRATIGYKLTRFFSIDAIVRKTEFKRLKVGSSTTDYALGSGLIGFNYGLGFSLQF